MTSSHATPAQRAPKGKSPSIRSSGFTWFAGLVCLGVCVIVFWPLGSALVHIYFPSTGSAFSGLGAQMSAQHVGSLLANTFIAVGLGTVFALFFGTLFAWLNERTDAAIPGLGAGLPLIPLMLPPIAGAIGWVVLGADGPGLLNGWLRTAAAQLGIHLGSTGPINIQSWPGLIFLYTIYLVPQVYLTVAAALRNIDSSLEEAAQVNGASILRSVVQVTLPALRPALVSATTLSFIYGFSLYSIPIIVAAPVRIRILAVTIVKITGQTYPPNLVLGMTLGAIVALIILAATWIQWQALKRARHFVLGDRPGRTSVLPLGPWRYVSRAAMVAYVLVTVVLPVVGLLIMSLSAFWGAPVSSMGLHNFSTLFHDPRVSSAIRNTAVLAVVCATIATLVAAIVAYYVKNGKQRWLAGLVMLASRVPALGSAIVVALALIGALAGPPFSLSGTLTILVIGFAVAFLPQAAISASAAMSQVGDELPNAARVCGAGDGGAFVRVTLPLMRPGLVSGWIFVFGLVMGDVTISVMLAGPTTPVVGYVMVDLQQSGTYPLLAAVGLITAAVSTIISTLVLLIFGRRGGLRVRGVYRRAATSPAGVIAPAPGGALM